MRYYKKDNKVYRTPIKLNETKEVVEKITEEDGTIKEVKKIITVYTSDEKKILEAGFEVYEVEKRRPVRNKRNRASKI